MLREGFHHIRGNALMALSFIRRSFPVGLSLFLFLGLLGLPTLPPTQSQSWYLLPFVSDSLNESDTTAPTNVQVTAPISGQTVSGTFTFKATAQDNSGTVQKMEFGNGKKQMGLLKVVGGNYGLLNPLFLNLTQAPEGAKAVISLRIRFIDSVTGYAVYPEEISVKDNLTQKAVYEKISSEEQAITEFQRGIALLSLPAGSYACTVKATGYWPMVINLNVDDKSPSQIEIHVDPVEPPLEVRPEFIRPLHRPDSTVIVGFIVDDDSGQPIPDVRVSWVGGNGSSKTDERGFFILHIPLPTHYEGIPTADVLFEKEGYQTEERRFIELMPNNDWIYRIRLVRGTGKKIIDERKYRRRGGMDELEKPELMANSCEQKQIVEEESSFFPLETTQTATISIPRTIRVGQNCGGTPCCPTCCQNGGDCGGKACSSSSVSYYSLETYVKYVLPNEWYACWGSLANGLGMNSLRAGAVAVRSYGAFNVRSNGRSGSCVCDSTTCYTSYDVTDNSCCQVFNPSRASTNTNMAVDQTAGIVIADSRGNIIKAEYASENGCDNPSTCIDPVCYGFARNGHGRGMCQFGSARWATGTRITPSSPCSLGTSHGYGTKDWQAILSHYYPGYQIVAGTPLQIGDRVEAIANVRVRSCPGLACNILCTASPGNTGIIVGGPQIGDQIGDKYTWWQVRWDDGTGNCPNGTTGWSVENYLVRTECTLPSAPSLVSPPNGASGVSTTPTLDWSDVTGATSYDVQVCSDSGCTNVVRSQTGLTASQWTVSPALSGGTTYYWRARAVNSCGASAWSATWSFTTQAVTAATCNGRSLTFAGSITPSGNTQTVSGSVTASQGVYYQFTLGGNSTVVFSMCSADGGSANYDTWLCLFDGNWQLITQNDDSCNLQSRIERSLSAGTYRIAVSGYGSSSGSFTMAYRASGGGGTSTNHLLNPGFESGRVNWTEYSISGHAIITNSTSKPPHSGSWYAREGGYDNATEYIYQDVTIPSNAPKPMSSSGIRLQQTRQIPARAMTSSWSKSGGRVTMPFSQL
jgi:hypothetical protein